MTGDIERILALEKAGKKARRSIWALGGFVSEKSEGTDKKSAKSE